MKIEFPKKFCKNNYDGRRQIHIAQSTLSPHVSSLIYHYQRLQLLIVRVELQRAKVMHEQSLLLLYIQQRNRVYT
jgi:hypothetical protein